MHRIRPIAAPRIRQRETDDFRPGRAVSVSPCSPASLIALTLMASGGLVGCALSPQIKAVSAQRVLTNADATEVRLTLELENPNEAPLELTIWEYEVLVNGRTAYSGSWVASLTLPANDKMLAEIPAVIPASAGDLTNATWFVSGQVGYRATRQIDRLLYQIGISRLNAGFGSGGQQVSDAPPTPPRPTAGPAPAAAPAPAPPPPDAP